MAFHGKQYKGAMRSLRTIKREEAEKRNALTPPERRSGFDYPKLKALAERKTVFSHG